MQRVAAMLAAVVGALALTTGTVAQAAPSGVSVSGGQLLLNGVPTVFTGINAYNATTDWSVNFGCGSQLTNPDDLFNSVPSGSLVRTWAFQALGLNKFTNKIDFTAIDRVVNGAQAHGDYLILALSDQSGNCDDGHWHDQAWYDGGYNKTYNDNGRGFSQTMSYLNWVKTVVGRYASNPTVAVYEPVNEPEASNCDAGYSGSGCYGHNTCPSGAATSLRNFFDTVGGAIKSIDQQAIVSTGTLGGNQCGVAGSGYSTINASPDVDVATYHDYNSPTVAMPAALSARADQASALGKAFIVEESGIDGSTTGVGCPTLTDRAKEFQAKMAAARRAGADGYLPWNWAATASRTCAMTLAPNDPLLTAMRAGTA